MGRPVFRRYPDGRVTADGSPDAADVCEALVARRAPALGAAVYVPVGPSARPGCARSGRLSRRLPDA